MTHAHSSRRPFAVLTTVPGLAIATSGEAAGGGPLSGLHCVPPLTNRSVPFVSAA
jgi:hypothetical protein